MLKPGNYTNKRGEALELVPFGSNENLLTDRNESRFYSHTGTCMFWSTQHERFFMDTDPKSDLNLNPHTPTPIKCHACGRGFQE